MAHTLKKFTEHSDYEEFMENPPVKNAVSICKEEEHVHYDEAPIFYDRLVFDGVAYINTGYVLPENCSIASSGIGYETQRIQQSIWGTHDIETSNGTWVIWGGATSSSNRQGVAAYRSNNYLATGSVTFSHNSVSLFQTPKRFGWGDWSTSYTSPFNTVTTPFTIGHVLNKTWHLFTGKMTTIRIYGPDAQNVNSYFNFASFTPIATFRPCIYKGEAGMWFVEEGRFCGNAADSGTLTVENI